MNKLFKFATTWLVTFCLTAMGWLLPALSTRVIGSVAAAATLTCDSPGTGCATVNLGGASVSYPTLQWDTIGSVAINEGPGQASLTLLSGSKSQATIDTVAKALNISGSQLANVVNSYNSNQPIVYGRYDPISARLHIDLYKVVRQGNVATVEHADFTPYMGKQWEAARYFIPSSEQASGNAPGVDPFAAFEGGDDYFHNIQFNGAMSVMGLVEADVRAPSAILVLLNPDINSYTTSSGGFFTKTVTEHVATRIEPKFFMIVPSGSVPVGAQAAPVPAFCATDPSIDTSAGGSCPDYARVVPSAAVLQANGGSYDASPTPWVQVYQNSQSGWSFIGMVVLLTIVSFGAADLLVAATGAAGGGLGLFGFLATHAGLELSAIQAVAFEAAAISALAYVVSGANGSGVYSFNLGGLAGDFQTTNITQPGSTSYLTGSSAPYWQTQETIMSAPALANSLSQPDVGAVGPYGDGFVQVPQGVYNTLHSNIPTNGDYQVEQPGTLIQNNNGSTLLTAPSM